MWKTYLAIFLCVLTVGGVTGGIVWTSVTLKKIETLEKASEAKDAKISTLRKEAEERHAKIAAQKTLITEMMTTNEELVEANRVLLEHSDTSLKAALDAAKTARELQKTNELLLEQLQKLNVNKAVL